MVPAPIQVTHALLGGRSVFSQKLSVPSVASARARLDPMAGATCMAAFGVEASGADVEGHVGEPRERTAPHGPPETFHAIRFQSALLGTQAF
jgi:hypothetical protein